jgi:hypothetical protein
MICDRAHIVRLLPYLAVAAFSAMLGACATGPSQPISATNTPSPQEGTGAVTRYLETMNSLANGTPSQQADVFYEVEREYTSAPTTANSLRYALALVVPSHPASDLVRGKKLLEQLLATPERLVAAERNLAAFLIKDADARLQLEAENRRLTATVDERSRGQANFDRRAQTLAEENARLRKLLDDAQQKLDAIKSIERSIIERSTPPTSRDGNPREPQTQSPPPSR